MNILAFDTSLDKTYIALQKGDTSVQKVYKSDSENYHSAYLISGLKKILEENSIRFEDLDLIAVNHGPGSFTGIRVSVTVAKTLAKELNKPVIGLNSLEILSKAYDKIAECVVLDARRGQFYIQKDSKICLVPYEEADFSGKTAVADSSSCRFLENSAKAPSKIINFERDDLSLAENLIQLAKERFTPVENFSWYTLNPLYVQAPPIHQKVLKNN